MVNLHSLQLGNCISTVLEKTGLSRNNVEPVSTFSTTQCGINLLWPIPGRLVIAGEWCCSTVDVKFGTKNKMIIAKINFQYHKQLISGHYRICDNQKRYSRPNFYLFITKRCFICQPYLLNYSKSPETLQLSPTHATMWQSFPLNKPPITKT